jgi:hypothetical protein
VTASNNPLENGLLSGFDLRALWETVRLRWWVIPITPLLAVGFLWAQETDLRTEPASYLISRAYEGRDPTGVLASVGIDPVSVRSFPDVNNQLLILQSAVVRDEIADQIGNSAIVNVTRSRPSFALIDTLESDGQSSFVFQSSGVPTYSFSCNEPERATCDEAIDAYVAKASQLRTDALRAGLNDLKAVLEETNRQSNDPALATKIAAIDVLLERAEAPLAQISEYEEAIGATLASVRRPTYTFGVAAGLVISVLILLQLTYSDTRVRSLRSLVRLVGHDHSLGVVGGNAVELSDRRVAVGLRRALAESGTSRLRFIPLRDDTVDAAVMQRIAELTETPARTSSPMAAMALTELTLPSTDELDVFVVQRNRDRRADVSEAMQLAQRSPRKSAGFLLVN